ncbi:MAG: type IV secretory system conjugative DNA transfer family protein [Cohaesibacter sp.]|nr:type IV secretory system conjugative DNA transfer family protein [Cohaesibacter sp.]
MLFQFSLQKIHAVLWKPSTHFGSARFARNREIKKAGLLNREGLILGRRKGEVLRYSGPGHLLTFAPTRSGKGAGGVIPNLLDYKGSAFVIDMKGENFAGTGRFRKTVGRVVTIAPFSDDVPSGGYNPLDFIRVGTAHEVADASLLADLIGPVPELCRSFESIYCNKGDFLWDDTKAKNFDKKRFALH